MQNDTQEDKIARQKYFIKRIKQLNEQHFIKTGKQRLMLCKTYGCQMNVHDSEKITGMLYEMGYGQAYSEDEADLVIFNTCCVRENAENKIFGNIGAIKKIKESKKDFKILVCGCMTQQDVAVSKIKQSYRYVDVVFGTFNLYKLPELLYTNYETDEMLIDIWEEHADGDFSNMPIEREFPFKASVNIMYGCNNFCSYCIVPYVRGREKSRASSDILSEIEELAKNGVKEVLLLGQNVNSYMDKDKNIDFTGLLEKVSQINNISRIRFMTSHPKDLSDRLIYAMRDIPQVCKYLHLPFQSGSSRILQMMNRKYTKDHYISLIDKLKKEIPKIAITTDIIVGFPSETEEDFQHTLDIVTYARFNGAYTFYYSKRTGTPAASMNEQIEEHIVKDRFDRLIEILNPIVFDINKSFEGQILQVLAESRTENGIITGRADNNTLVHFAGNSNLIGEICNIKITEGKPFYLIGEKY